MRSVGGELSGRGAPSDQNPRAVKVPAGVRVGAPGLILIHLLPCEQRRARCVDDEALGPAKQPLVRGRDLLGWPGDRSRRDRTRVKLKAGTASAGLAVLRGPRHDRGAIRDTATRGLQQLVRRRRRSSSVPAFRCATTSARTPDPCVARSWSAPTRTQCLPGRSSSGRTTRARRAVQEEFGRICSGAGPTPVDALRTVAMTRPPCSQATTASPFAATCSCGLIAEMPGGERVRTSPITPDADRRTAWTCQHPPSPTQDCVASRRVQAKVAFPLSSRPTSGGLSKR